MIKLSDTEPKLTEVTISVRIPIEVADLIKRLCEEEIDGMKVLARTDSQVARDCLIRGIREIGREKGLF